MFDANMRYTPKGWIFFCKLHSFDSTSIFYEKAYQVGDLVLCRMLSEEKEHPKVEFYHKNGNFILRPDYKHLSFWAVFEGNVDGSGFIDPASESLAIQILDKVDITSIFN